MPTEAQNCADGLYLLFEQGRRPDRAAVLEALAAMPKVSVSHDPSVGDAVHRQARLASPRREGDWLELLQWGMTFDCLGLAPGPAVAVPAIDHRFNIPSDAILAGLDSVALVPGPHLADAANSLPIVRAMLEIGAGLANGLDRLVAVCWAPARSAIAPAFFTRSVKAWMEGGAFPAMGLVGFVIDDEGRLRTDGLAWFTGQEIALHRDLSGDRVAATRMAVRLVHELVAGAPIDKPVAARIDEGTEVLLAPVAVGLVEVTRM